LLEILKAQVNLVASNVVRHALNQSINTSLIIQRKMDKLGSVMSELYDLPFYKGI